MDYILSIDQSTSLTKALLFNTKGSLIDRVDIPHHQFINELGWYEHDAQEIYQNLIQAVGILTKKYLNEDATLLCAGLSNQRETTVAFDATTGIPLYHAIVWQCSRAKGICTKLEDKSESIKEKTGMNLSPYFSAAKMNWLKENVPFSGPSCNLRMGTIDSYIIYHLSGKKYFKTDYSNACRTQLLNIDTLDWDDDLLSWFGIERYMLPQLCDSNSLFCMTDFEGVLPYKIPLHAIMGDSQSALFAQRCTKNGMAKATYGNGSSVMMNTGNTRITSKNLVSSIGWKMGSTLTYVLEGNINFSGSTTRWLVENLKVMKSAKEAGPLAAQAKADSTVYLVPAFTGLGSPYWHSEARAAIVGMDLSTSVEEIVRAGEEAIAYQINDVLTLFSQANGKKIATLRVDGGPTLDNFLMQFQSDISDCTVDIASIEELSAEGVALVAGLAVGAIDKEQIIAYHTRKSLKPHMDEKRRKIKKDGWNHALRMVTQQN